MHIGQEQNHILPSTQNSNMQTSWLICLSTVFGIALFLPQYIHCDDPSCFQVSSSNCLDILQENVKCKRIDSDRSSAQIFCCNITSESEIKEYITNLTNERYDQSIKVRGFHLRDSNLSRLHEDVFKGLSDLVSLAITETNILQWSGTFSDGWMLSCFNFSHNTLGSNISSQFIMQLRTLRNFAISNTNIDRIPELPPVAGLFTLDVSGNSRLLCGDLVTLTTEIKKRNRSLTFVNKNSTTCVPPHYRLFHMQLTDIEKDVQVTFDKCPSFKNNKCECSVFSLDYAQSNNDDKENVDKVDRPYMYLSLVNCSSLGMQSLPNSLPPNTRVLDISNNSIRNFDGIGNATFNSLLELYADNNLINTLKHLEGTDFLESFQNLTLRNNKIDQIQEYLFTNKFDRNSGGSLMLAKNYFKCDCYTASKIKLWLSVNKAHVPDYDQIYADCDNYPTNTKVIDLNPKDLCSKPTNWKDYIRYVIGLEVLMFVLLIGKVSYDYYVFKTAGYLPWPASKMPKLPCDWCFET